MSKWFEAVWVRYDTILQARMCSSCHWVVGLDEGRGRGVLCRRCRVYPRLAAGSYASGEQVQCWCCGLPQVDWEYPVRFENGVENRQRCEVFCGECLRRGIDLYNALEYAFLASAHSSDESDV